MIGAQSGVRSSCATITEVVADSPRREMAARSSSRPRMAAMRALP
jgi:hypothetical protein